MDEEFIKILRNLGTKWYQCPNGHAYTIGECGLPMEESICPECKEKIGGRDHIPLKSNRMVDFDKDVKNNIKISLQKKSKENEKLVSKVESGIAADHIKATPMPEEVRRKELTDEEIQNAGDVTTFDYPCWDEWAGRYFSSTRAKIERAILAASARAGKEMFVPMNYIYDELNMACSAGGAENGFNSGDLENGLIPVKFYTIDDETYGPVLVMSLKPQQEERW